MRCLLSTSVSTCFGYHYVHLQENKDRVTAYGVLRCNKRVCMRLSCVNGCVVALDWYLPRTFFRSGVSGAGVLMHALCLLDGRSVWCRCY